MSTKNHEEIWSRCLAIIKDNVNLQSYKTWFEPIKPLRIKDDVLTIQVPSQFFYEWLEEHYITLLKKTVKKGNRNRRKAGVQYHYGQQLQFVQTIYC